MSVRRMKDIMKKLLFFLITIVFFLNAPRVIYSSQKGSTIKKTPVKPVKPAKPDKKVSGKDTDKSVEKGEKKNLKKELEEEDASGLNEFAKEKFAALQKDAYGRLTTLATNYTWSYFKNKLDVLNPNRNQRALVTKDVALSYNEKIFRSKRIPVVRKTLEKFFDKDLSDFEDDDLRIGFVGTGGGYRALILTAAYLAAFQEIGLYDAFMYLSSLSGSTWTVAPMISLGATPASYVQVLLTKVRNNQFSPLKLEQALLTNKNNIEALVNTLIWPKFVFGQPIRSIDFYGFLLSQVLFGPDGYKQHLSDQWPKIRDGAVPMPIYTAVSMSQKEDKSYSYDWWEFNPVDVRVTLPVEDQSLNFSIPSYSFASEFTAGKNLEIAPEQGLGYMLGIFGSAYAINFKDISRFVADGISKLEGNMFSLEKVKYFIASSVVNIIKELDLGKTRFSPAQIFNPLKGVSDVPDWLKEKDFLTLVDAGIAYNIPARPLLWPARKLKVIIIGESSSSAQSAKELKKFFADAKATYDYNYKRIDDGSNKTLRLYKDLDNPKAPRIIYITFLKDEQLMILAEEKDKALRHLIQTTHIDTFDPSKCIENSFCGTFNFDYTEAQMLQLLGMAEFNVRANKEVLTNFLRDEIIENLEDINFPVFGNP